MTSTRYYDDDPDGPQEVDLDWPDSDEDWEACPSCGRQVHDLTEKCPDCGYWIGAGEMGTSTAARRARGWYWPVMVALLIAMILVYWVGL